MQIKENKKQKRNYNTWMYTSTLFQSAPVNESKPTREGKTDTAILIHIWKRQQLFEKAAKHNQVHMRVTQENVCKNSG